VFVIDRDGGNQEQLMPGPEQHHDPSWSPDGTRIVLAPWMPGYGRLLIYDVAARKAMPLPGSEGLYAPRWSPDGRFIYAILTNHSGARVFDTVARNWSNVSSCGYPSWSRDSRWIYGMTAGGPAGALIARIDVCSSREGEIVASFSGMRMAGALGPYWMGLTPNDEPLILQDTGVQEVYSFEIER